MYVCVADVRGVCVYVCVADVRGVCVCMYIYIRICTYVGVWRVCVCVCIYVCMWGVSTAHDIHLALALRSTLRATSKEYFLASTGRNSTHTTSLAPANKSKLFLLILTNSAEFS